MIRTRTFLQRGTTKRCDCSNVLENHPLKQKNVIEEGLKIVLGNITRGYCTCWENDVNHFYKITASISLVHAAAGNTDGESPLLHAVRISFHEAFESLLEAGAKCDVQDEKGNTALMMGVIHGMEYVQPLINKGANLNIKNKRNQTAMTFALQLPMSKKIEMERYLVKNGAEPNVIGDDGNPFTVLASNAGDIDVPQELIKQGVNVHVASRNARGQTALHGASWNGFTGFVNLLPKIRLECDTRTYDGHTPLSLAAQRNQLEVVNKLLPRGCNVNNMDKDGNTPLLYATLNHNLKMVSKLVNAGANPDCRNAQGQTALHIAAWNGCTDIVDLLLKTGMEHDTRTNDGNTPLSLAAHKNHFEVINLLLPLGCNVNNMDKDNDTPLLYATYNSNFKMVCKLVNAGANPDCRNKQNTSPLWNAVYKNDYDTIRYLLVKNVELEINVHLTLRGRDPLVLVSPAGTYWRSGETYISRWVLPWIFLIAGYLNVVLPKW
uniref:Ankyrin-2 n=1 Tax=Magallana gigas TaxID=29159 RepID=K1RLK2_MAGGI